MGLTNDVIAVCALALVGPAVLFMTALFVRQVVPPESAPARTADRIVRWYSAHPQFALWVLLLLLPFSALMMGIAALLRTWGNNPELQYYTWRALEEIPEHWPAMSIGGLTLLAMAVLVMITAHIIGPPRGHRHRLVRRSPTGEDGNPPPPASPKLSLVSDGGS